MPIASLKPPKLALMRVSRSSTLRAPLRSISSRVMICTGSAVSASARASREPVMTTRSRAISCGCAAGAHAGPSNAHRATDAQRPALHLLEQVRIGRADGEGLRVALQPHFKAAVALAMHGSDLVDIDHRAAMNLPKQFGVQFGHEVGDRLANQRLAVGGDHQRVLAVG